MIFHNLNLTMAGYSGTPLVKKLGIKEGMKVSVIAPPAGFWDLLVELPEIKLVRLPTKEMDFILLFVKQEKGFASQFEKLMSSLAPAGILWIGWPKKTSGIESDLGENRIRDIGLAAGLVDVKVCAINEQWSGLKFVRRLNDR